MEEEEKEFTKKINIDKAMNKTRVSITIIIISILTYVYPLVVWQVFDFGIIFEIISLIFLIIARMNMKAYSINGSRKFTILAMISAGWLLVYDFINLCLQVRYITDIMFIGDYFILEEMLLIVFALMLYLILRDIAKAENPVKYKTSTDWFYEKYEGKEKVK